MCACVIARAPEELKLQISLNSSTKFTTNIPFFCDATRRHIQEEMIPHLHLKTHKIFDKTVNSTERIHALEGTSSGPLNTQFVGAMLTHHVYVTVLVSVARGDIGMTKLVTALSLAKTTSKAEVVLKTCELYIYGGFTQICAVKHPTYLVSKVNNL
jgi:hypothetical protein